MTALRSGLGTLIDLYKEVCLSLIGSSDACVLSSLIQQTPTAFPPPTQNTHTHTQAALSSSTSAAALKAGADGLAYVDEFLAFNVLVQAYDTVRASGGGAAAVEAAGWGKLLLQLRRALTALYSRASGGCQLPPQTRLALRVLVALATEDHMAFLRLYRSGAPAPSARAAASGAAAATTPTSGAASSTVLVRCLLHRFLPVVRRRILDVWSKTLFKKERMPLIELARLLAFDTPTQAKAFSAVHGVAIVEMVMASLDAWGDEPQPCSNSSAYIEPRLATVSQPAVGQTYEARRKQRRALAPRQDRVVLELEKQGGLAALWDAVGGTTP